MKLPASLDIVQIREALRFLNDRVDALTLANINMDGRRVINAGASVQPFDYVTKTELADAVAGVPVPPDVAKGSAAYQPTNVTVDRAYDADTVVITELADIVGTLIADLQRKGILS